MTRKLDGKFEAWLVGYYDDFIGSFCQVDDKNNPNGQTYDHELSHHGNTLNGEAPLNPRFRHSVIERLDGSDSFPLGTWTGDSGYDQAKPNNGVHEYITLDSLRLSDGNEWEGRATPRAPQSFMHQNRAYTGISGGGLTSGDGYMWFVNPRKTNSRYWLLSEHDGSYGRADMKDYAAVNGANVDFDALSHVGLSNANRKSGYLTGYFQWESMSHVTATKTKRTSVGQVIKSLGGKPFLVLDSRTYSQLPGDPAANMLLMMYEGNLNSIGDKDIFHMRMAHQSMTSQTPDYKPFWQIDVGFLSSAATVTATGFGTSSAITQNITMPQLAGGFEHHARDDVCGTGYGTTTTTALDDIWNDIDIVINYTTQTYDVYVNGTSIATDEAMNPKPGGGTWAASDLYGWSLTLGNTDDPTPGNRNSWQVNTLIDRVGLIHPITNHVGKTVNSVALESFNTRCGTNAFSNGQVKIVDDGEQLDPYPLISGYNSDDWSFLLFRNGDNRPIYQGTITRVAITQNTLSQTRTISVDFSDNARSIDRQTAVWEIGQTLASGESATGLLGEAERLYNSMYFGAAHLKSLDDKIGYVASNYEELRDQRTQLYSSHPIQLYNNEETLGPNNPEINWNSVEINRAIDGTSAGAGGTLSKTVIYFPSHGLSAGNTITISGSSVSSLNANHSILSSPAPTTDYFYININTQSPSTADAKVSHFMRMPGQKLGLVLDSTTYTSVPLDIYGKKIGLHGYSALLTPYSWDGEVATVVSKTVGTGSVSGKDILVTDLDWSTVSTDTSARFPIAHGFLAPSIFWERPRLTATGITDTGNFLKVANRANHAVWMRDLPKSKWFQKMFGRINETAINATSLTVDTASTATEIYTLHAYGAIDAAAIAASGIGEIVMPNGQVDSFCFSGVTNASGRIRLDGVKFLSANHLANAVVRFRTVKDDYKHIWVLWSDMRNNGNADADGSTRKNKFGLLYPTPDNYDISLEYTDQETIDGKPSSFVNLKVGYDCDMWECDAEIEPFSGGSWSALGSDSLDSKYRNWEDKAGSFIILDFSRFFNLNTEANGGKTGQTSGGRISLGDLVIDTEGHPALIDDYWQEVPATPANSAAPFSYHENWHRFFSAGSNLAPNTGINNIAQGATTVVLDDTSEFPNSGMGMIELERDSSNANTTERNLMFFTWSGKNDSTNTLSTVSIADLDETALTEDEIRETLTFILSSATTANAALGSPKVIRYNDSINNITNGYDKIVFYSGLSAPFALRFMMKLNGFIESPNIGTYYMSDVFRALSVLSGADIPLNQFSLPVSFDINNIPITRRMTTTQQAVSAATRAYNGLSGSVQDWDDYGGAFDARGKSIMSVVTELSQKTRSGDNGQTTIFTYTTGRDGKLDFRPAYNSGFSFTRNNLRVSQIEGSPQSRVTNVRVYYNNGASFIDYPSATTGSELRWKYVDLPSIKSNAEALQIAKREYERAATPSMKITAEPLTPSTDDDKMLFGARYGYVADPALRLIHPVSHNNGNAQSWTSWLNGVHYSGMQNCLDGNLSWAGFGTGAAYFSTKYALGADGGGSSGALVSGADHDPSRSYTWVGTKSVSDAVRIVHIPKDCPLTSNTSSDDLRIGILLADSYTTSTSVDDVEFYLTLIDPNVSITSGGGLTTISDGYGSTTSVKFKHSGFYEIGIPSTYWTSGNGATGNERIVVSINAEYLRALLRHRNGNYGSGTWQYANAHDVAGFNTTNSGSEVRAYSPFPLGLRNNASIPTGDAPIFHAPRIIMVEDINFTPGTVVSYTDSALGLSSATNFTVKDVQYSINNRNHDSLTLTLEQDESRALEGMAAYIMPDINSGRTPGTTPTYTPENPGAGEGGNSGGGGGSRPSFPPPLNFPGDSLLPPAGGFTRNFDGVGVAGGNQGISGQLFSSAAVGVNNTTAGVIDLVKGKMDFNSENGNLDGDFSILGQKKGGAPAQSTSSIEGVDSVWSGGAGASFTSEGAVFPGDSMSTDSLTQHIHEHSIQITVPADTIGKLVVVEAKITTGGDNDQSAILFGTVECTQTGDSVPFTCALNSTLDNKDITICSADLNGANVAGNTIKITIQRQAGKDNDDARYGSVVLHSIKTKFVRAGLNARSSMSRVLGLKGNGIRFSLDN